jgi:iron complex transport system ATP-binding protein
MKLDLKEISFTSNNNTILKHINLELHSNCIGLIGSNGSGKTTLLKVISGILKHSSGSICLDGININNIARNKLSKLITYIPQERENVSGFSLYEYVELGRYPYREIFGTTNEISKEMINYSLESVGLINRSNHMVDILSGGEMQVLRIARALAQDTKTILFDEPTSNLDLKNSIMVFNIISNLVDKGIQAIISSHDLKLVNKITDYIVMLNKGNVYKFGSKNIIMNTKNLMNTYELDYDFKEAL